MMMMMTIIVTNYNMSVLQYKSGQVRVFNVHIQSKLL